MSLEVTKVDLSANVHLLEVHDRALIIEVHRLQQQVVVLNFDNKRREARRSTEKRAVTDAKVELAIVKEAMLALEEQWLIDRLLVLSVFKDLIARRIN